MIIDAPYPCDDDGKTTVKRMRGSLITTWRVQLAVLICLWTALSVGNAYTAASHHCPDLAALICEHVACGDLDDVHLERVTSSILCTPPHPMTLTHRVKIMLPFSLAIFQPPEVA